MSDAEDYVRNQILKTGFPLELEIFSILKSKSWITTAQDYYYDEDANKARYIDLSAFPEPVIIEGNLLNPVSPVTLNWNLSIECKKSKKNWVFFPVEDWYIGTSGQSFNLNMTYLTGLGFGHYEPNKFKTASVYTMISTPEGKDEIFEAVMQLVKYVSYSKNKIRVRTKHSESSRYSISFWFPIIVLDGKMWNVSIENGQIVDVAASEHTLLKVQYGSKFEEEAPFIIDVVHKSYFPKLMDIIHQDITSCQELVLEKKEWLIKHLDDAFSERQKI